MNKFEEAIDNLLEFGSISTVMAEEFRRVVRGDPFLTMPFIKSDQFGIAHIQKILQPLLKGMMLLHVDAGLRMNYNTVFFQDGDYEIVPGLNVRDLSSEAYPRAHLSMTTIGILQEMARRFPDMEFNIKRKKIQDIIGLYELIKEDSIIISTPEKDRGGSEFKLWFERQSGKSSLMTFYHLPSVARQHDYTSIVRVALPSQIQTEYEPDMRSLDKHLLAFDNDYNSEKKLQRIRRSLTI